MTITMCPRCGSYAVRKSTAYWQCITCRNEWQTTTTADKETAMPRTLTKIYYLPPAFYGDHVARGLPAGELLSDTKSYVRVALTREDYEELLSDAGHYAGAMGEGGFDGHGLIASARATVKRLEADPFPEEGS